MALVLGLAVALVLLASLFAYALATSGNSEEPDDEVVEVDYQNEDYELPSKDDTPPELEIPTSDEAVTLTQANPIYAVSLAVPVRCSTGPVGDGTTVDDAVLQAHFEEFVACLTRVWGPALEEAGLIAYQPTVTVFPAGGTVNTQCGTAESNNAFYCAADQSLYLASDVLDALPQELAEHRFTLDLIMAHEYGHAMQGRSGIFAGGLILMNEADESEAMELNRRLEVQADCFAGTVTNSLAESMGLTDDDRAAFGQVTYEIGDDRLQERFGGDPTTPGDHGTGENRKMWAERGLAADSVGACNTFVADPEEVK
ncbi:MAG: neutral zinc metallopeptidase [Arachnia sp.]